MRGEIAVLTTPTAAADAGVVVQLAVGFVASSGLSVLIEINRRAKQDGIGFAVVAIRRSARRPLVLSVMDQIFSLYASVPDDVEALRQAEPDTGPGSSSWPGSSRPSGETVAFGISFRAVRLSRRADSANMAARDG